MKNNKGWGTLEMILLCIGLLIALIISIYFISVLYKSFGIETKTNKQYEDLEVKLSDAAKRYIGVTNLRVPDGTTSKLTYEVLKEKGYIAELKDSNGKDCTGYVIIQNVDTINHFTSFIKCKNYTSNNY